MLTTGKERELGGMGDPEVIVRHHRSSGDVVQYISEPCPQRHRVWVGDRACVHPSIDHPCTPSFNHHHQNLLYARLDARLKYKGEQNTNHALKTFTV